MIQSTLAGYPGVISGQNLQIKVNFLEPEDAVVVRPEYFMTSEQLIYITYYGESNMIAFEVGIT